MKERTCTGPTCKTVICSIGGPSLLTVPMRGDLSETGSVTFKFTLCFNAEVISSLVVGIVA